MRSSVITVYVNNSLGDTFQLKVPLVSKKEILKHVNGYNFTFYAATIYGSHYKFLLNINTLTKEVTVLDERVNSLPNNDNVLVMKKISSGSRAC